MGERETEQRATESAIEERGREIEREETETGDGPETQAVWTDGGRGHVHTCRREQTKQLGGRGGVCGVYVGGGGGGSQ